MAGPFVGPASPIKNRELSCLDGLVTDAFLAECVEGVHDQCQASGFRDQIHAAQRSLRWPSFRDADALRDFLKVIDEHDSISALPTKTLERIVHL